MRQTVAVYGPRRRSVRVFLETGGELVRVQWYEHGHARKKSWPNTGEGRAEAKAWAKGFAEARTLGPLTRHTPLTLRALWERYVEAEFAHLRPKTTVNYLRAWGKWELYLGRDFVAEDARIGHLDGFRAALRSQLAVGHIRRTIQLVKTVHAWGEQREYIRNRLAAYRFKQGKHERETPPPEYSSSEREAILAALNPQRADQWRPWAAIMLGAHQGARMVAILHLRVEDVQGDQLHWKAAFDKQGKDFAQPLTFGGYAAILTALEWRRRDRYTGPWLFYSSHATKRDRGDASSVYHPTSLERALRLAEQRAGVVHRPYRGMHGLRKGVTGDVARASGDPKLALDFINDTDLRRAREYIQPRQDQLQRAAAIVDRPATVLAEEEFGETKLQVATGKRLRRLPRQDSNLRPVGSSDSPAAPGSRKRKHLAKGKQGRKARNGPKTGSAYRPQTVPPDMPRRTFHRKGSK